MENIVQKLWKYPQNELGDFRCLLFAQHVKIIFSIILSLSSYILVLGSWIFFPKTFFFRHFIIYDWWNETWKNFLEIYILQTDNLRICIKNSCTYWSRKSRMAKEGLQFSTDSGGTMYNFTILLTFWANLVSHICSMLQVCIIAKWSQGILLNSRRS